MKRIFVNSYLNDIYDRGMLAIFNVDIEKIYKVYNNISDKLGV